MPQLEMTTRPAAAPGRDPTRPAAWSRGARTGRGAPSGTARRIIRSVDGAPLIIGGLRDGTGRPQDRRDADRAQDMQRRLGSAGLMTWAALLRNVVLQALTYTDPVQLRAHLEQVDALTVAWMDALDQRHDPALA